jgi:serine/threonine protein kinase
VLNDNHVPQDIQKFVRQQQDIVIDRCSPQSGGGWIYFGERKILCDRVALKFYALDPNGSSHAEPLILKAITHENIVPIIDARVLDNNYAYYLTPEISGGDLQQTINSSNLSTNTSVAIVQGILKGLNELHLPPRNLVHRDLKTYNILIDSTNVRPHLADFGEIRQLNPGVEYTTASRNTLMYRPPEVILEGKYYKQSDLYQVGIILFQCLNGFFPFSDPVQWLNGKRLAEFNAIIDPNDKRNFLVAYVDKIITSGKVLDYNGLPVYIPNKLRKIVRSATHIDLQKRFSNCSDFLKALHDYQQNSIDWYLENSIIYSSNLSRGKKYRIVQRKTLFVCEMLCKGNTWRKKIESKEKSDCIKYIETSS